MANTLDGTLISPLSNITLARFGGWQVKLVRDDGVLLTPTTLLQSNSRIFFSVRDQDNVSRILSNWTDGVFSPDAQDIGKNFKFNEATGFWSFNFADSYSSGWKPSDSPLGFKLIIIPRNSQNSNELSNNTVDTQMAKEGNGGPKKRINETPDFENQDNLIKQGIFTVNMPVWKFRDEPNPTRLQSSDGLVNDPFGIQNGDGGDLTMPIDNPPANQDGDFTCGHFVEISIPYELEYKSGSSSSNNRTYETDQGEFAPSNEIASFIRNRAGHVGSEIYRSYKLTVSNNTNFLYFPLELCRVNVEGSFFFIGAHVFTAKNFDLVIS